MQFPVTGDTRQVLVDGTWREGRGEDAVDVRNPSTGEVLFRLRPAGPADVDDAVAAAWTAFRSGPWSRMPGLDRGHAMLRLGALIRERRDELAELEAANAGIPVRQSRFEVVSAARHIEYFAGLAGKVEGESSPLAGHRLLYTLREPLGVVGQSVPWNSPLKLMARGCAAALACGNTLVIKPSALACASVLYFGTLVEAAGLPKGVVNIVPGPGRTTGTALVRHPGIRKLVFIGGREGGQEVLVDAGRNITPVLIELGGKGPIVVCDDVDVEEAVEGVISQAFARQGEVCFAGTRLFLPDALHDEFVERLAERSRAMRVGDALDDATDVGPLISPEHLESVMRHVDGAVAEGAQVLPGGGRVSVPGRRGNFMRPTILTGATQAMRIAREEVFGPVLPAIRYTDIAQAIADANATEYGLAGYIWCRDIRRAHQLAAALECGCVLVNTYRYDSEVPFGGYKRSGYGREHGLEALREYTQVKSVVIGLERWRDVAMQP